MHSKSRGNGTLRIRVYLWLVQATVLNIDKPVSIRSLFTSAFLVTFNFSKFGNFHTDVVLKLFVHSWFVAKFEKYFQMNEERGENKR